MTSWAQAAIDGAKRMAEAQALVRGIQIDRAVRTGIAQWQRDNFISPRTVLEWIEHDPSHAEHSTLIDCVRRAWREQHHTSVRFCRCPACTAARRYWET